MYSSKNKVVVFVLLMYSAFREWKPPSYLQLHPSVLPTQYVSYQEQLCSQVFLLWKIVFFRDPK